MTEEVNRSGGVHLRLGRRQAPTLRGIYRDAKYGGKHQQGNFAGMGLPRLVTLTFGLTLTLSSKWRGNYVKGEEI